MALTIEQHLEDETRLAIKAKQAGASTCIQRTVSADISRPVLDESLKPMHEAFRDSGMNEDELSDLLVKAKKQMHAHRRAN
jgi:hypothetical protein